MRSSATKPGSSLRASSSTPSAPMPVCTSQRRCTRRGVSANGNASRSITT
jgi:hypothetical protein